jgi:hypothetical protein
MAEHGDDHGFDYLTDLVSAMRPVAFKHQTKTNDNTVFENATSEEIWADFNTFAGALV